MTANAPQTQHEVQYFSSPVRITTKAVELRDRLLPLEDVESAKVIKVIPGKQPWEQWIGWIVALGLFGAISNLLRPEAWQLGRPQQALLELGMAALVVVILVAVLRWFYFRASEKWRTYYVPRVFAQKEFVSLAVFEEEQRAVEIVTAIEEAQARRAATPGLDPETLYRLDNSIEISDEGVAINGAHPIPALRLRVAYKNKIEVKQTTDMKSTLLWAVGIGSIGGIIAVVGTPLKPIIDVIGPYVAVLIWGIIGIGLLYVFVQWLRDKERLQSLDDIYVCRLRTDDDEFEALLTPDKQYIEAVIAAINSLVPKPDKRNGPTA